MIPTLEREFKPGDAVYHVTYPHKKYVIVKRDVYSYFDSDDRCDGYFVLPGYTDDKKCPRWLPADDLALWSASNETDT